MMRVIGIDPGTVSIDLCGLADGRLWLDQSWPTADALAEPERFVAALTGAGPIDLIAGPSGYGLPLLPARDLTDDLLRLAFLSDHGETGGIGGLKRLVRLLADSGLPVLLTPGVIHLPTIPASRKVNRVDMGTADKLATTVLGIFDQARRFGGSVADTSFIMLELGGAFTAAVAVERGQIVDGQGGSSGPMGWRSSGAWDGEVAFLAGQVTKDLLFKGGADGQMGGWAATEVVDLEGYCESATKAVLALTSSVSSPRGPACWPASKAARGACRAGAEASCRRPGSRDGRVRGYHQACRPRSGAHGRWARGRTARRPGRHASNQGCIGYCARSPAGDQPRHRPAPHRARLKWGMS